MSGLPGDQLFAAATTGAAPDGERVLEGCSRPSKRSRCRRPDWSHVETKLLVGYKKETVQNKEKGQKVWEKIACRLSETKMQLCHMSDVQRSSQECRRRWDTLKKVYKHVEDYCIVTGLDHWELEDDELKSMKLATEYKIEWYTAMKEVCDMGRKNKRDPPLGVWIPKGLESKYLIPIDSDFTIEVAALSPVPLSPAVEKSAATDPSGRNVAIVEAPSIPMSYPAQLATTTRSPVSKQFPLAPVPSDGNSVNSFPLSNSIAAANDAHDLTTRTPTVFLSVASSSSRRDPVDANALLDDSSASSACDVRPESRETLPISSMVALMPSNNQVFPLESASIPEDLLESLPSVSNISLRALFDSMSVDGTQLRTSETTSRPATLSIPGYDAFTDVMKSIMLHLIICSPSIRPRVANLDSVCKWLAIVLEEDLEGIRTSVKMLCAQSILKVINRPHIDQIVDIVHLRQYFLFAFKELKTHPNEERWLIHNGYVGLTRFVPSKGHECMKVLIIEDCENLFVVHLEGLPNLCFLWLRNNQKLRKVVGWETLRKLCWLHWENNKSPKYLDKSCDCPDFKYLTALQRLDLACPKDDLQFDLSSCTSLQEIHLRASVDCGPLIIPEVKNLKHLQGWNLRLCKAKGAISDLSRLTSLVFLQLNFCDVGEEVDLSSLVNLTYFNCCDTEVEKVLGIGKLNTLRRLLCTRSGLRHLPDLRGLTFLVALTLAYCQNLDLKAIPYLDCLVNLEYLDVRGTSLEDISGVEKLKKLRKLKCTCCSRLSVLPDLSGYETGQGGLSNLVSLTLGYCAEIKTLPNLSYLTDLMYLSLCCTSVKYIPGVENLSSLTELDCSMSDLDFLPDLGNLIHLRGLNFDDTPLQRSGTSVHYNRLEVSSECTTLSGDESDDDEVWDHGW